MIHVLDFLTRCVVADERIRADAGSEYARPRTTGRLELILLAARDNFARTLSLENDLLIALN